MNEFTNIFLKWGEALYFYGFEENGWPWQIFLKAAQRVSFELKCPVTGMLEGSDRTVRKAWRIAWELLNLGFYN